MRATSLIAAVFTLLALAACSAQRQADKYRDLAETSVSAAEQITQVLEQYPAGQYEGNALLEPLLDALPEKWHTNITKAVDIAGDVRAGATAAALELANLAENLDERAANMQLQADKQAGFWSDLVAGAVNLGQAVAGPGGIAAGIMGIIAAIRARRDTENVVRAVDTARRADENFDAAIKSNAGAAMNMVLTARGTQDRVNKIRAKLNKHKANT
jgi:hypothetical protein